MPSEVISDELIRHYEVILLWTGAAGDGSLYTLGNWVDATTGAAPLSAPETVLVVRHKAPAPETVADVPEVVLVKTESSYG